MGHLLSFRNLHFLSNIACSSQMLLAGSCLQVSAKPATTSPATLHRPNSSSAPFKASREEDRRKRYLLVFTHFVFPAECRLDPVSLSRLGYKKSVALVLDALPCSLIHLLKEASCCVVSCPRQRPTWPRADVWPRAREASRPANSSVSEHGSRSSPP